MFVEFGNGEVGVNCRASHEKGIVIFDKVDKVEVGSIVDHDISHPSKGLVECQ